MMAMGARKTRAAALSLRKSGLRFSSIAAFPRGGSSTLISSAGLVNTGGDDVHSDQGSVAHKASRIKGYTTNQELLRSARICCILLHLVSAIWRQSNPLNSSAPT